MSELEKALAAVGEAAPVKPTWLYEVPGAVVFVNGAEKSFVETRHYALSIESLALRLAVRLAEVQPKPCERCRGRGWFRGVHAEDDFEITCNDCKGTGKEQPR